MKSHDWLSVGEFTNLIDADLTSKRLSDAGIPNRVVVPQNLVGGAWGGTVQCYVWVPPEAVDQAKSALATSAIPDDELTKLALDTPPPDDA